MKKALSSNSVRPNLYMRLIDVRRICELRLFPNNIREDDVLLEQKYLKLLWFLHRARIALSVVTLDTENCSV